MRCGQFFTYLVFGEPKKHRKLLYLSFYGLTTQILNISYANVINLLEIEYLLKIPLHLSPGSEANGKGNIFTVKLVKSDMQIVFYHRFSFQFPCSVLRL